MATSTATGASTSVRPRLNQSTLTALTVPPSMVTTPALVAMATSTATRASTSARLDQSTLTALSVTPSTVTTPALVAMATSTATGASTSARPRPNHSTVPTARTVPTSMVTTPALMVPTAATTATKHWKFIEILGSFILNFVTSAVPERLPVPLVPIMHV